MGSVAFECAEPWVIYLDFLGAAMDRRIFILLLFVSSLFGACQPVPIQVNSVNLPQAGPRLSPENTFSHRPEAAPLTAGFEQVGNTLTWFNEEGRAEAAFLIRTKKPSKKPDFQTKSEDLFSLFDKLFQPFLSDPDTSLTMRNGLVSRYKQSDTVDYFE